MDEATARELVRLTNDFYAQTSASFDATRQAPWLGWRRVFEELRVHATSLGEPLASRSDEPFELLDLACGNLRFERFLAETLQAARGSVQTTADVPLARVHAFDACEALVGVPEVPGMEICFAPIDILQTLFAKRDLTCALGSLACDLAVCFGFMHHVPLASQRAQVLASLVQSVRPGGSVAVAFWQLSQSERLLAKARATTAAALPVLGHTSLDEGDYLLGWQGSRDALRYCHDFSEGEIDVLVETLGSSACELARFSSDGAEGTLNRYLVLQRVR